MTIDNIPQLSNTAADNVDIIGANVAENSPMASLNNAFRNMGKMLADLYDDLGAVNTVAGTADAIELTSKMSITALATGLTLSFKASGANTTEATLALDGLAAKKIRRNGDSALQAGDIAENGTYTIIYDAAYDSATGGWILLNPSVSSTSSASTTAQGVVELATTAEFRAGTDTSRALVVDQVWSSGAVVTLTDATTIAVDMSTFINAQVTLGGNRELGPPSNAKIGQCGFIRINQDGTGSRTLSYHADWQFAGGTAPVLSTGASDVDVLFYQVMAANFIYGTLVKDLG